MKKQSALFQLTIFLLCITCTMACKKMAEPPVASLDGAEDVPVRAQATGGELLFQSGFKGTSQVIYKSAQFDDIQGNDGAGTVRTDWVGNLEASPYFSSFQFGYEQGNASQRKAAIVTDPTNSSNKALRYTISDAHIYLPNVPGYPNGQYKARVQSELINTKPAPSGGYIREYYQKERIYLSPSFIELVNSGAPEQYGWLTLMEFWNDPQWQNNSLSVFRMSVKVAKNVPQGVGQPLRFLIDGQYQTQNGGAWYNKWDTLNRSFAIPIGQWMTVEVYIKEGNAANGRFYMSATVNNVKTVICDVRNITQSLNTAYTPDGLNCFSPMKVYCSKGVTDAFKSKGKLMQVYWDDLEIWKDRRP